MGLFFEILKAINNPNQQGSIDQIGTVVNAVQQLGAGRGINASTLQTVLSSLGESLRPVLKAQGATGGTQSLENMISQFTNGSSSASALPAFLTPQLQQQIAQGIAQATGLNASTVQSLLPGVVSVALGFLGMGSTKPGFAGTNSVLSAFLDGDRDGDTDLGDVLKFASRFLNPPKLA